MTVSVYAPAGAGKFYKNRRGVFLPAAWTYPVEEDGGREDYTFWPKGWTLPASMPFPPRATPPPPLKMVGTGGPEVREARKIAGRRLSTLRKKLLRVEALRELKEIEKRTRPLTMKSKGAEETFYQRMQRWVEQKQARARKALPALPALPPPQVVRLPPITGAELLEELKDLRTYGLDGSLLWTAEPTA
jgi:hypothetical protein